MAARLRRSALAALLALAAGPAAAAAEVPAPGAPGGGDPLFPRLGNGGYDVAHYDLGITYRTRAHVQRVPGVVTVHARATQALSRLNLDFTGDAVRSVAVDGAPAVFSRRRGELRITPAAAIAAGQDFAVRVAFVSGPRRLSREDTGSLDRVVDVAWFATPSGSITAAQPDGARRIFPCNDMPADPATYTIRASTPRGVTFVANGDRIGRLRTAHRTHWTYAVTTPMASELLQLAFGDLTVRQRGTEGGVRLRDVAPRRAARGVERALRRTRQQLRWLVGRIGPYPFGAYGSLVSDATFPFALENQTLSLYPASWLQTSGRGAQDYEPIMVHELAHQWFGDSVMPANWSDLWLNEGHATWYEWQYAAEHGPVDYLIGASLRATVHAAYEQGDQLRKLFGPVASPRYGADDVDELFSTNVYDGGALVLYALRQEVGDATFRRIESGWPVRYVGRAAGTDDFIAFASEVAGRDLTAFLRAWLYGRRTPPMPGHPNWKVDQT